MSEDQPKRKREFTPAEEFFWHARECQRAIDRQLAVIGSMRAREAVRAQRYDSVGGGAASADAMRLTDARIDAEAAAERELAGLSEAVFDARAVCAGVRAANHGNLAWGYALEMRYCDDMTWRQVAAAMGVSERQAQADCRSAIEWVDSVGIARARDGMGQAALF